jgi:hypothetical protein
MRDPNQLPMGCHALTSKLGKVFVFPLRVSILVMDKISRAPACGDILLPSCWDKSDLKTISLIYAVGFIQVLTL